MRPSISSMNSETCLPPLEKLEYALQTMALYNIATEKVLVGDQVNISGLVDLLEAVDERLKKNLKEQIQASERIEAEKRKSEDFARKNLRLQAQMQEINDKMDNQANLVDNKVDFLKKSEGKYKEMYNMEKNAHLVVKSRETNYLNEIKRKERQIQDMAKRINEFIAKGNGMNRAINYSYPLNETLTNKTSNPMEEQLRNRIEGLTEAVNKRNELFFKFDGLTGKLVNLVFERYEKLHESAFGEGNKTKIPFLPIKELKFGSEAEMITQFEATMEENFKNLGELFESCCMIKDLAENGDDTAVIDSLNEMKEVTEVYACLVERYNQIFETVLVERNLKDDSDIERLVSSLKEPLKSILEETKTKYDQENAQIQGKIDSEEEKIKSQVKKEKDEIARLVEETKQILAAPTE